MKLQILSAKEYNVKLKATIHSTGKLGFTEATAKELDIDLIAVTGEQGKVGALAALGLYNDVEEAVKAYDKK